MKHPDLEKQLYELRQKKTKMVREFTRKSVDTINLSEQAALTNMSICEGNCAALRKTKKLKKSAKSEPQPAEVASDDQAA